MAYTTIPGMFIESTKANADRPAYFEKVGGVWKGYKFGEVRDIVEKFAAGLASLGLGKDDKIAIQSTNCPRWAFSDYAIASIGAVSVTVYPTLISSQIKYIIDDSDSQYVITQDQSQTDKILQFIQDSPKLKGIIAMDNTHDPAKKIISYDHIIELGAKYKKDKGFTLEKASKNVKPNDLLTLIYTSGTTGNPKGVMLSHDNLISNVKAGAKHIDFGTEDTFLSLLPLSHVFERMTGHYTGFSLGSKTYYAENNDTIGENMLEVKPTIVIAVPRVFEKINAKVVDKVSKDPAIRQRIFWWAVGVGGQAAKLLTRGKKPTGALGFKFKIADKLVFSKLKERVGGNLRFFVSGGAPLSKEVGEFFASANIPILEGYGLTETSPVITANQEELYKFGTVGCLVDKVQVKIAKDGEILCKGPNVMMGYYKNPEATKEAIDKDGWFHTGDIGMFDEDNYLKITDRKKSILVTAGGKNVAPAPLEIALTSSKYIEQALAVGDRRKFVGALIVPSFEVLEEWAKGKGIEYSDRKALIDHHAVHELFDAEVAKVMEKFSRYEQIKKYALLPKEWTIESGETTPKLSVKRKEVEKNYASIIDGIYAE
ncbi:long-chain fatty acid--CoA ligase [bacterium]|nr:long-chain fatty acid--CoA ligase [bacterium]